MAIGLQGSAIGQALNAALDAVAEGTLINEKEALLDWIANR